MEEEVKKEKDTKPAFTKEQFFGAWMDSREITTWNKFVHNIQKHAKDKGAKVPSDVSVNMRLHKYTKEITGFGGTAPAYPKRPSKMVKPESKADFWARMGVIAKAPTL
jgi:hypothetical protein